MAKESIEIQVQKASEGDKKSLELVIVHIKELVYNLSLRMFLFPQDAEDATQEILVKIVTHLSTFKNQSKFETWVYRVATNYLLTLKSKKNKELVTDFTAYGQLIDTGHSDTVRYTQNRGEQLLLEEEVKVSCSHGLLLCLNKQGRMVYILGEILEFNSIEGGQILDITPENFRKQLSRSRTKLRTFLQAKCGLVNPSNPCRCHKKIDHLIDKKLVRPTALRFARPNTRSINLMKTIDTLERTAALYRSTGKYKTPEKVVQKIKEVIQLV